MYNNVLPAIWMQLEKPIKDHLVKVFDIKRTGISEIRDQTLISDGYSVLDLQVITLERMTEYIGSNETFPRAWELTCAKAKYELNPPMNLPKGENVEADDVTRVIPESITETNVTETKKISKE